MRSSARRCARRSSDASKAATAARRCAIARYATKPEWQGKDLAAIAAAEKKTPLDIVLEIERNGGAQIVNFGMNEEDVRLFMKQPFVATASDGSAQVPGETVPHPRSYGTFPRKIGRYAIEDKVIPLEQAIRSASGLPADILQLPERGYLKAGLLRRRRRLRPEDVPRQGDVRQAAPVRDRRALSVRQRQAGDRGRQVRRRRWRARCCGMFPRRSSTAALALCACVPILLACAYASLPAPGGARLDPGPRLFLLSVGVEPGQTARRERDWYARDAWFVHEALRRDGAVQGRVLTGKKRAAAGGPPRLGLARCVPMRTRHRGDLLLHPRQHR